jgi:hypothetical protein
VCDNKWASPRGGRGVGGAGLDMTSMGQRLGAVSVADFVECLDTLDRSCSVRSDGRDKCVYGWIRTCTEVS